MKQDKNLYCQWFDSISINDIPLVGGEKCLAR